jgi:hypothetical protein
MFFARLYPTSAFRQFTGLPQLTANDVLMDDAMEFGNTPGTSFTGAD